MLDLLSKNEKKIQPSVGEKNENAHVFVEFGINPSFICRNRLLIKSDGKPPTKFKAKMFKASLQYRIKILKYEVWLTRKRFQLSDDNIIDVIDACFSEAGIFHVVQSTPTVYWPLHIQEFIRQLIYRPFLPYFGYRGGFRFRRPSKGQIYRLREALKRMNQ